MNTEEEFPWPEYKGVKIPEVLIPNITEPEYHWWKVGVDSALEGRK